MRRCFSLPPRKASCQWPHEKEIRRQDPFHLSEGMIRKACREAVRQHSKSACNGCPTKLSMGDYGQKLPKKPDKIQTEEDLRTIVLLDTLRFLEEERSQCIDQARKNVNMWHEEASEKQDGEIRVLAGDWGDITGQVAKEYGAIFAALNVAHAYDPGGAYTEGLIAQEENMFRRTDCHFSLTADYMNRSLDIYHSFETELIHAINGEVYLDIEDPRVCIRGREERMNFPNDLGYKWLRKDEYFLFYELRAAPEDLRDGRPFQPQEMRRRIKAQLKTCINKGVKHVVLGAFGCGARGNPAEVVAKIYYEEVALVKSRFVCIVFAIFYPGYGQDNFTPFESVFKSQPYGPGCAKANQAVQLLDHPSGKRIIQVPKGEVLTVLSHEGVNVKVRWKITEGWSEAGKLDMVQAGDDLSRDGLLNTNPDFDASPQEAA